MGEGRKMWGQLPAYPSPMVEAAPLNPSMGAVFMQSLMVPTDSAEGDGSDSFPGQDEGQEDPGAPSGRDLGAQVGGRLAELANSKDPEPAREDLGVKAGVMADA